MWNDSRESYQLLADVSKVFVSEIAPEELDYVDELLEEYRQDPPSDSSGHGDDPLGFGGEVLVAVTPAIAMALEAVFKFLRDEVIKSAKDEGAALIATKIKALFNPKATSNEAKVTLTPEQLQKIKALTKKEAQRGGMSAKKAEDFALRVVGRLSIAG